MNNFIIKTLKKYRHQEEEKMYPGQPQNGVRKRGFLTSEKQAVFKQNQLFQSGF